MVPPTAFDLSQAMFDDFQLRLRKVENLPTLRSLLSLFRREVTTTAGTVLGAVNLDPVGYAHPLEGVALMASLSSALLAPVLREARLGGLLLVSVTAWRFVTVAAVGFQTTTQLGVLRFELGNLFPELGVLLQESINQLFQGFDVVG